MSNVKQYKYCMKDFHDGIEAIMRNPEIRTVTVFCSPLKDVKQRIRITRKCKNELIITYGKPNWKEREFLKLCKKAKCNPRRFRFIYKSK